MMQIDGLVREKHSSDDPAGVECAMVQSKVIPQKNVVQQIL